MQLSSLGTRVARRILLLFVVCALAPIGILSLVTFWRVADEQRAQARIRLEQASKASALLLFKRLRDLDTELGALATRLAAHRGRGGITGEAESPSLRGALASLAVGGPGERVRLLFGRRQALPPLPAGGPAHLASGKPLLVIDTLRRVWLVRPLEAGDPASGLLWAEPTDAYLWSTLASEAALAPEMRLCAFQASGDVLYCALERPPPVPGLAGIRAGGRNAGFLEWRAGEVPHVAAWWALFVKYEFFTPELILLVSEPKASALSAVRGFRRTFVPVILLTVWLVLLLSYVQIRRTIEPLARLQAGTRRLAALDFSDPVSVQGGDEFGDLAASFNTMAGRLQHAFERSEQLTGALQRTTEALRESEERLRTILETAADGVITTDADGVVESLNGTAERMFGYARDEVVGRSVARLLASSGSDGPAGLASFRTGELLGRRKDGSLFPLELAVSQARLGGRLILAGFARDISARKRADEERRLLEAELRQAQKMETIGTLAGGIAHDFNNILTAVMGYVDLALAGVPRDGAAHRDLLEVRKGADRAAALVRQILLFSRKGEHKAQEVDLAQLAGEAGRLLRAAIPSTIEIRVLADPATPSVLADPTQLHQVLMNLGTNAYHAMRATGGLLEIQVAPEARRASDEDSPTVDLAPGEYARITVRDTGHGMDRGTLDRVFEPFFTTKPVGEGTGLGLAVVHGIVTTHGGAITVESEPGRGATFTVLLPAAPAGAPRPEAAAEPAVLTGHGRVLVVDDDRAIAELMKTALDRLGYAATAQTSSREALELFRRDPRQFDLVITDYTMPELTGAALARELRRLRPDLPLILATGLGDQLTLQDLPSDAFQEYLAKPIGVAALAAAVRRALGVAQGARP